MVDTQKSQAMKSCGEVQMKTSILPGVAAVLCSCMFLVFAGDILAAEDSAAAVAVIHPLQGEQVRGVVHFAPTKQGLLVRGELRNLEPGMHGFHVHQYGDCTAPRQDSVGPHFLPIEGQQPGIGHTPEHDHHGEGRSYLGDLPPIEAGRDEPVRYEATVEGLSLSGLHSVIGRSILVHSPKGEMIGCGVIGIGKRP
jgi:superoxide dismutase, Cu-Zn family